MIWIHRGEFGVNLQTRSDELCEIKAFN